MRTDKNLVQLLINERSSTVFGGLCNAVALLKSFDKISNSERKRLDEIVAFIEPHRRYDQFYYWNPCNTKIRIQKLSELQFDSNGKLLEHGK
ncbi:hypothetical protein [Chryseobacterium defluvii]|uniref:Uncharacterized protein n=1 Tax=Chryseobacterium defluvii TaxID=160396 RepID=A0A495SDI3_9FLAO|nr:hypothetical protein [Chryseobacterium defluvii]RKS98247.1 hypothetical protein BCF58_2388 [Chryseobacterium defluvii]